MLEQGDREGGMAREAMLTPENVDRAALERWGGLCCNVEVSCGVQVRGNKTVSRSSTIS